MNTCKHCNQTVIPNDSPYRSFFRQAAVSVKAKARTFKMPRIPLSPFFQGLFKGMMSLVVGLVTIVLIIGVIVGGFWLLGMGLEWMGTKIGFFLHLDPPRGGGSIALGLISILVLGPICWIGYAAYCLGKTIIGR